MTDRTKRIIQSIALKNGVTPKEIEADMRSAIRAGMSSDDPHTQAIWKQIAPSGIEPSIDAFLDYMINRVTEQNKSTAQGQN